MAKQQQTHLPSSTPASEAHQADAAASITAAAAKMAPAQTGGPDLKAGSP